MASRSATARRCEIPSSCTLGAATFPVRVSALSCDGCRIEADADWPAECDFLHLCLGGEIEINGRALRRTSGGLDIRFFGQIHPVAVDRLAAA